jgi:hypothetical protein
LKKEQKVHKIVNTHGRDYRTKPAQIDANSSSKARIRLRAFHLEALPRLYHEDVITAVCDVLLESNMPKSKFCRLIFLDLRFVFFAEFSQTQIAEFLEVARSLVSRCKAQAEKDRTIEARRQGGRPSFLQPENEQIIWDWLKQQITTRDWLTPREVKQ